ncbi:MAG: hypothetical protein HYY06_30675 [Deltaproteobacteria bacterium]|nr:hypothetical protein [Deltaproteobacteria bacterium]
MRLLPLALLALLAGCDGRVGAPCRTPTDCRSPPMADCLDWPEGYCTAPCGASEECGPEGACVEADDRGGMCLRRCGPDAPCRPGYACNGTLQGVTVCWPE